MNYLTVLTKRLKSETPKFFKKLLIFMASLTVLGGALMVIELPEELKNLPKYLMVAGAVGAFFAKLTTTDTVLSKK